MKSLKETQEYYLKSLNAAAESATTLADAATRLADSLRLGRLSTELAADVQIIGSIVRVQLAESHALKNILGTDIPQTKMKEKDEIPQPA